MLIFDKFGIKVFVTEIAPGAEPSRRSEREHMAISKLLREAFPDNPSVCIAHHPSGAPYLIGEEASISISHCSRLAALAIAPDGAPLGIDCETTDRNRQLQRVKTRFLSPEQLPLWQSTPENLLQAWCIKEALYKALLTPGLPLTEIPLPSSPLVAHEPTAPHQSGEPLSSHQSGDRNVSSEAQPQSVFYGSRQFRLMRISAAAAEVIIALG